MLGIPASDANSKSVSLYSRYPFDTKLELPFDVEQMMWMELTEGKPYEVLLKHLASSEASLLSYATPTFTSASSDEDEYDSDDYDSDSVRNPGANEEKPGAYELRAGLGLFITTTLDESKTALYCLHQQIGKPLATQCGVQTAKNLVIFTEKGEGKAEVIADFLKQLIDMSEKTNAHYIKTYKWHARHEYWKRAGTCRSRDIDSVILPSATKEKIVGDVGRFLQPSTKKFYVKHGIPYRRSYLFYGVPGAGKTSMIQAIAGMYKRNIFYLQLTDKDMTDNSLLTSISELSPNNTVVVIEDVDSCFRGRSNQIAHSQITFSGLLNALDGVGTSCGQIFILTTNLKDQLDPALIRCGRVDVQVHFDVASDEQITLMWNSFYPEDGSKAPAFVEAIRAALKGDGINTASLQHFFVVNMHSNANEAITSVARVLADVDFVKSQLAEEKKLIEAEKAEKEAANEKKGTESDDE